MPPDPLEVVTARIARIALVEVPRLGRVGPGPVITVVRNTQTGKIYVGFNTGVPKDLSDALNKAIQDQHARISNGEVIVVRTDPKAVGGHAEVNALNPAIAEREKVLGRKLVEQDLGVFELHNLWLSGKRAMTTAPRCEHCARIARGVSVTQSIFVAEGGVVGETNVPQRGSVLPASGSSAKPTTTADGGTTVPQRGSVIRADSTASRPATTADGGTTVPQRGSATPAGSTVSRPVTTANGATGGPTGGASGVTVGQMAGGVAAAVWVISLPLLKQWFAKNYLNDKWTAETQAMVVEAIEAYVHYYNMAILARRAEIEREKTAGREVKLRVDVDTEWVDTDFGPAQIAAKVSFFSVVLAGETVADRPLDRGGFWSALFRVARVTKRRSTYFLTI